MVDNFFSRIHGKKTQNYIKHKRHIWSFSTLQRAISIKIQILIFQKNLNLSKEKDKC